MALVDLVEVLQLDDRVGRTKNFRQLLRLTDGVVLVRTRKEANPVEACQLGATMTLGKTVGRVLLETLQLRSAVAAPDVAGVQQVFSFPPSKRRVMP
jgi:hypothetical protein